jgi:hypothetical protein
LLGLLDLQLLGIVGGHRFVDVLLAGLRREQSEHGEDDHGDVPIEFLARVLARAHEEDDQLRDSQYPKEGLVEKKEMSGGTIMEIKQSDQAAVTLFGWINDWKPGMLR